MICISYTLNNSILFPRTDKEQQLVAGLWKIEEDVYRSKFINFMPRAGEFYFLVQL